MATKSEDASVPGRPTRIFIVDDHPLVREGLAEALGREPDFTICGEAEDRLEALQLIEMAKPHLVIVDLALKKSNGIELIKDIRVRFPKMIMLVVSMQDELLHAERVIQAGAAGYITKEQATVDVVRAVRQVLRGERFVSPRVAARITARVLGGARSDSVSLLSNLSDRELEVLQLLGDGMGRRQIAERLKLDVNTIETYRSRLKEKLQLRDAGDLLQFAIQAKRSGYL